MGMFEELFGAVGTLDKSCAGKRAFAAGIAWIVLAQVKGEVYMAVRAGLKYPAPVELVKIRHEEFIKDGVF